MVKIVHQFIPGILDILYGKNLPEPYDPGFDFFIDGYSYGAVKVLRTR